MQQPESGEKIPLIKSLVPSESDSRSLLNYLYQQLPTREAWRRYDKELRSRLPYFIAPAGATSATYSYYVRALKDCPIANVDCSASIQKENILLSTLAGASVFGLQWFLEGCKRRSEQSDPVKRRFSPRFFDNLQASVNIGIDMVGMNAVTLSIMANMTTELVRLIKNTTAEVDVSNAIFWGVFGVIPMTFAVISNPKFRVLLYALVVTMRQMLSNTFDAGISCSKFRVLLHALGVSLHQQLSETSFVQPINTNAFLDNLQKIVQQERGLLRKLVDTLFEHFRGCIEGRGWILIVESFLAMALSPAAVSSRAAIGVRYGLAIPYGIFNAYLAWHHPPEKDDHYWHHEWPYRVKDYLPNSTFLFWYFYNLIVTSKNYLEPGTAMLFMWVLGGETFGLLFATLYLCYMLPSVNIVAPTEQLDGEPSQSRSINNIEELPEPAKISRSGPALLAQLKQQKSLNEIWTAPETPAMIEKQDIEVGQSPEESINRESGNSCQNLYGFFKSIRITVSTCWPEKRKQENIQHGDNLQNTSINNFKQGNLI